MGLSAYRENVFCLKSRNRIKGDACLSVYLSIFSAAFLDSCHSLIYLFISVREKSLSAYRASAVTAYLLLNGEQLGKIISIFR